MEEWEQSLAGSGVQGEHDAAKGAAKRQRGHTALAPADHVESHPNVTLHWQHQNNETCGSLVRKIGRFCYPSISSIRCDIIPIHQSSTLGIVCTPVLHISFSTIFVLFEHHILVLCCSTCNTRISFLQVSLRDTDLIRSLNL